MPWSRGYEYQFEIAAIGTTVRRPGTPSVATAFGSVPT
jgi:hypothetical protein